MSILDHNIDAKSVTQSTSARGLFVAMAASVAPSVASSLGMPAEELVSGVSAVVQAGGFLWSLYGILSRCDIKLPWQ
jgi:hypothetical protein